MSSSTPPAQGRPRDPAVEGAILRATRELLVEKGFAGMTVDAVANAAHCGKAAVYRRWPSKTALVVAAVREVYEPPPVPNTGSLRGDVLACILHYTRADEQAALALASLLSANSAHPDLKQASYESIGRHPVAALRAVLERWVERGAILPSTRTDVIAGLVPILASSSILTQRRGLRESDAIDLVDHVLLPALTVGITPSAP